MTKTTDNILVRIQKLISREESNRDTQQRERPQYIVMHPQTFINLFHLSQNQYELSVSKTIMGLKIIRSEDLEPDEIHIF